MNLDGQVFTKWRVRTGYLVAVAVLLLAHPTPRSLLLGGLVGMVGLVFRGYAAGFLHKQEQLTTSGPYDHTRNPLYFGSALLTLAAAIATHSLAASLLLLGYFAVFYSVVMRREEEELRQRHGATFEAYARTVPLFFPRLGPLSAASGGSHARFSWLQYKRNHEWQAAIGFLFLIAVLVLIWRLRLPN
jgi:protein-S-isoprenylcysteine O-methyltransferase Ste14